MTEKQKLENVVRGAQLNIFSVPKHNLIANRTFLFLLRNQSFKMKTQNNPRTKNAEIHFDFIIPINPITFDLFEFFF